MLLAIDPGLEGTGWAVFRHSTPVKCGIETASRRYKWFEKLHYYCEFMERLAVKVRATECVLERPVFMQSSGGMVTAKSDSLVKLAMLVGALYTRMPPLVKRCTLVTPNQWKGQLPKTIAIDRIQMRLDSRTLTALEPSDPEASATHDWDALGIGLNHLGKF